MALLQASPGMSRNIPILVIFRVRFCMGKICEVRVYAIVIVSARCVKYSDVKY